MQILMIGDVGVPGTYHVGDEALLEAAVRELRARGLTDLNVISYSPTDTARRYQVAATPQLGFDSRRTPTAAARQARLDNIDAAARGRKTSLAGDDPCWEVIAAVVACDAVLIAGGGNLSATWPDKLCERAALAGLAEVFGKPLVLTSQTLGPVLDRRAGELLAGILGRAVAVGLREPRSVALAEALGAPAWKLYLTGDDARALPGEPLAEQVGHSVGALPQFVLMTFSGYPGLFDPANYPQVVADCVRQVRDRTGLPVLLVPHTGPLPETRGVAAGQAEAASENSDSEFHQQVAELVGSEAVACLPTMAARQVVALQQRAALVVCDRLHPVVFGCAAGVPAIGLTHDEYTHMKIAGAMTHFGLGGYALPAICLNLGGFREALTEVWARRDEIAAHLHAGAQARDRLATQWWDRVEIALRTGARPGPLASEPVAQFPAQGSWATQAATLAQWSDSLSRRSQADRLARAEQAGHVGALGEQVASLRVELAEAREAALWLKAELDDARARESAAHELVEQLDETLARALVAMQERESAEQQWQSVQLQVSRSREQLAEVVNSRSFRLTAPLRRTAERIRGLR